MSESSNPANSEFTPPAHGPERSNPSERRLDRKRRRRRHRRRREAANAMNAGGEAGSNAAEALRKASHAPGLEKSTNGVPATERPAASEPTTNAAAEFPAPAPVEATMADVTEFLARNAADAHSFDRRQMQRPFLQGKLRDDGTVQYNLRTRQRLGSKYLLREVFE